MAAAGPGNNPVANLPKIDGGCTYTAFRGRPEGKVPCFGLGPTTPREIQDAKGEIRGIYFQKVDTGNVKAALRVDSFLPVRWADAPTQPRAPRAAGHQALGRVRDLNNRLDLGQIAANNVRPQWQEFTDAVALAKGAMLNRMVPVVVGGQQPQQPQYLLDGFHEEMWRGAPGNDQTLTSPAIMLDQIKTDIGARANWNIFKMSQDNAILGPQRFNIGHQSRPDDAVIHKLTTDNFTSLSFSLDGHRLFQLNKI